MPPARATRAGTIAKLSIAVVVLSVAAATLLELRKGAAEAELVAYARTNARDPLDLVEHAARTHRLLFLADVPHAAATRRFAAHAIERLATGPGLDLVVLDVDAGEQPFIDRYLATAPEDVSILMARPRAIRADDGAYRSYVDIYRTVWRANQQLGAHRRIRIVAADRPGWPPDRATARHHAASMYGERDAHMMDVVMRRALEREPGARALFFVNGLHALRTGGGRVQTGGTRAIQVRWLAARLAERFPHDVYTILTDAAPARVATADVAAYRGTRAGDIMRQGGVRSGSAFVITQPFDNLTRSPIRTVEAAGIDLLLEPRAAPLSTMADAYIYFGN
jgi:hypothetical protein